MVDTSVLQIEEIPKFYQVFTKLMEEGYDNFSYELISYFLKNDYSPFVVNYWIEKKTRKVLLAKENNQIVGFLVGDYTYGGVAFISWIGVLPEYRGQGIARQLFGEYQQFAISRKAHLIELFTYEKIVPFYEKLGFYEIGRRANGFYGHQNIIMNKVIGQWSNQNLQKVN